MNKEQIIVRLKDLYRQEKSMKFVVHLIHSYIPIDKAVCIKHFTDTNNYTVKCSLTGNNLVSKENFEDLKSNHRSVLDEDYEDLKNVELAYRGVNTNSYLCYEALQALHLFTEQMCLAGDKRINYVISQLRKK